MFPRRTPGVTPAPRGALSIYDPAYLGLDARGKRVHVTLPYRNILIGGEPGAGKSVAQGNFVAHAALCTDVDLILIDGKIVELLPYAPVAKEFVGNNMPKALRVLKDLQADLDERYLHLARTGRKKIVPGDGFRAKLLVIDELAYFTVTVGTKEQQEEFRVLVRDIVARGRAAGIITIASTQRPSADIVPTSLRDLFGYRLAFRCATDSSSRHHPRHRLGLPRSHRRGHRTRIPGRRTASRRRRIPPPPQDRTSQRPRSQPTRPSRRTPPEGRMITVKPVPAGTPTAVNDGNGNTGWLHNCGAFICVTRPAPPLRCLLVGHAAIAKPSTATGNQGLHHPQEAS